MSERMACRLAGLSRSAYRRPLHRETAADPDRALRDWLRAYAKKHPRWGYRRAYHDARAEGWTVNHKKIQRLWREEGLRVPQRRRRKRVGASTADAPSASAPNLVWAVDFQFDSDERGRPIKICSIVDEHTRECIGGLVDRSITATKLTDHLEALVAVRGAPATLRCDNGPELISEAMAHWAGTRTGLSYIPPGSPWRNGYIESFNSRVRDECLNINTFYSLLHARVVISDWKTEYNHDRRHSSLGRLSRTGRLRSAVHPSNGNRRLAQRPDLTVGAGQGRTFHGSRSRLISAGRPRMSCEIELRPAALRALKRVDRQDQPRIQGAIALLAADPRPPGAKALQGCDALRIRVGDYRTIYTVQDNRLLVIVVTLGHRREVDR